MLGDSHMDKTSSSGSVIRAARDQVIHAIVAKKHIPANRRAIWIASPQGSVAPLQPRKALELSFGLKHRGSPLRRRELSEGVRQLRGGEADGGNKASDCEHNYPVKCLAAPAVGTSSFLTTGGPEAAHAADRLVELGDLLRGPGLEGNEHELGDPIAHRQLE